MRVAGVAAGERESASLPAIIAPTFAVAFGLVGVLLDGEAGCRWLPRVSDSRRGWQFCNGDNSGGVRVAEMVKFRYGMIRRKIARHCLRDGEAC